MGLTSVADPLGGSWFVEELTDRMEAEAEAVFAQIRRMGERSGRAAGADADHPIGPMTSGILRGIEDGWFIGEIADAAFAYQTALEKGEKKIVGVNCHTQTTARELEILRVGHEVERDQVQELSQRRTARDDARVRRAVADMVAAARTEANLVPPMLEAVRAEATLGEICDALRREWGGYSEAARF